MLNVLMVTWDAGGNVPPLIGLGRELLRRGHRVRCLGPIGVRARVESAGIAFRPLVRGAVFDALAPLPLEQSQQAQGGVFFSDGYIADLRREVEIERPDVVVIDCFLAAAQAEAERLGVPFALLVHTLPGWFLSFWDEVLLLPTNTLRERVGLPRVASTTELWARADRVLVASTALLDSPNAKPGMPPGRRYVGPIFEPEDLEAVRSAAVPDTTEPVVVVGFSTTFMDQERPLARVIDALRSLPVRGLVTAGPAVDAAALPSAEHALRAVEFIRTGSAPPEIKSVAGTVKVIEGDVALGDSLRYLVPRVAQMAVYEVRSKRGAVHVPPQRSMSSFPRSGCASSS